MINYYDDIYLYNDVAFDQGIIDQYEHAAMKQKCEDEVAKYRRDNVIEKINTDDITQFIVFDILIGSIPYIGLALGNTTFVNAATLDQSVAKKISDPANASVLAAGIANSAKFKTTHTIYELYEEVNGEKVVKYVGRTRQKNIRARQLQHWNDPAKNGLKIRVVEYEGKVLENLPYTEARGLEQIIFDLRGGLREVNGKKLLLNKINPIREGTDITAKLLAEEAVSGKGANYLRAALKFLGKIK